MNKQEIKLTHLFALLLLGIFILTADILSKYLVQLYLPIVDGYHPEYPYGGIGVFKDFFGIEFSICHTINKGAAWGILGNFQHTLLVVRIILILGVIAYLGFFNKDKSRQIPLVLIISGALGNILDYFRYGHVVDMFHFVLWGYDFPVFNLADTAIFLGVCWMMLLSFSMKTSAVPS